MRVTKDTVVSLSYTIRDEEGRVVDSSDEGQPLTYLHGYQQIVPGVESAVEGLEEGRALEVAVEPKDGYGDRDPDAILILPRRAFPPGEELEPGSVFRAFHHGRPVVFSVLSANSTVVVVDANHPLAGQTLRVQVQIISVRRATVEERVHKHVHNGAASPEELA